MQTIKALGFAAAIACLAACASKNSSSTAMPAGGGAASFQSVTTRVGPSGGTVRLANGLTLVIPPGALTQDVDINISQLADDAAPSINVTSLSATYAFAPDGLTFILPATLTMPVTGDPASGDVYWTLPATTDQFQPLNAVPAADGTSLQAPVTHFSRGFAGAKQAEAPQPPITAADEGGFTQVRSHPGVAQSHTCALRSDSTVWCWGSNDYGQLGAPASTVPSKPVQVKNADGSPLSDIAEIAVGLGHSCAIKKASGEIWCWGANDVGQLGVGSSGGASSVPVQVRTSVIANSPVFSSAAYIAASNKTTCVIKSGSVYCWGGNEYGLLGQGQSTYIAKYNSYDSPSPKGCPTGFFKLNCDALTTPTDNAGKKACVDAYHVDVPTITYVSGTTLPTTSTPLFKYPAESIAASDSHVCVVNSGHYLWCWGGYDGGRRDNQAAYEISVSWPNIAGGASDCYHLPIFTEYLPYLGTTTLPATSSPILFRSASDQYKHAGVALGTFCGVRADNYAWCQGIDMYGQVGDRSAGISDQSYLSYPTTASLLGAVNRVNGGREHFCAVLSDKSLWCWGSNSKGQVGVPMTMPVPIVGTSMSAYPVSTPSVVSGGLGVTGSVRDVTLGAAHTCAIKDSDGTVYCWGDDSLGQLGDGASGTGGSTPVQVTGFHP